MIYDKLLKGEAKLAVIGLGYVGLPIALEFAKKVKVIDLYPAFLDKENQWLLCSENQIVWVIGKRADNRYIVTNTTQQIIKIDLT